METQLKTWLRSSQDPTDVANKVKGAILLCSSLIIGLGAAFFHIQLTSTDVLSFATELGTAAGAMWTLYGFILHVITWMGTERKLAQ